MFTMEISSSESNCKNRTHILSDRNPESLEKASDITTRYNRGLYDFKTLHQGTEHLADWRVNRHISHI